MLKLKDRYSAQFYGFINSDVLLSPSIFPILEELLLHHANQTITDEVRFLYLVLFVVLSAGVAMEIAFPIKSNNGTIPMDNPVVFTRWMNLPEHKKINRDRGSADFWIFHHTTDFSRFHPVVIGRDVVDTYIMGATRYWNHSMIDCTFAGKML